MLIWNQKKYFGGFHLGTKDNQKRGKMTKILAGNWKLNKNTMEVRKFFQRIAGSPCLDEVKIAIFPAIVTLQASIDSSKDLKLSLGSQNSSEHIQGAFTGEISASVVAEMGARLALLGHSERRSLFGEADQVLSRKVKAAQEAKLKVCFCIGETLQEREENQTDLVLKRQLEVGLSLANKASEIWIAYEPVWAIGTGKVASVEQVQQAHHFIKNQLTSLGFNSVSILYGGSVKPDNAAALASIPNVDGFLVGGASLEVESLEAIAKAMK